MAQCPECQQFTLVRAGEAFVCITCGTQSQQDVVEAEHEDVNVSGGARRRVQQGPRAAKVQEKEEVQVDEVLEQLQCQATAYLHCLQRTLQEQCDVLPEVLGVIPAVGQLVRSLWFLLLPECGLLDVRASAFKIADSEGQQGAKKRKHDGQDHASDAGPSSAGEGGEDSEGDSDRGNDEADARGEDGGAGEAGEDVAVDKEKAREERLKGLWNNSRRVVQVLSKMLPPQTSLVLILLGCVVMQQPITPVDIVRAVLNGRLPYLRAPDKCWEYLRTVQNAKVADPVRRLLQPTGCNSPAQLMASAHKIAKQVKLQLPAINAPPILYRMTVDLNLPEAVFSVAHELYRLYLDDTDAMLFSVVGTRNSPYTLLAALVATATYLCYGLGGEPADTVHILGVPPPPRLPQDTAAAAAAPGGVSQQAAGDGNHAGAGADDAHGGGAAGGSAGTGVGQRSIADSEDEWLFGVLRAAEQHPAMRARDRKLIHKNVQQQEQLAAAMGRQQPESGWGLWAEARLTEFASLHPWPASTTEIESMPQSELMDYLAFLRTHVAHPGSLPQGLQALDTWLQSQGPEALRAPPPTTGDQGQAGPSSGAAGLDTGSQLLWGSQGASEGLPGSQSLEFLMATQEWTFEKATEHVFAAQDGQPRSTGAREAAGTAPGPSGAAAGPPRLGGTGAGTGGGSGSAAGRDGPAAQVVHGQAADQPPAAGAAGQLCKDPDLYVRLPADFPHAGSASLPADLLAVVCVCAAWVNAQPSVVLHNMSVLQHSMRSVEERLRKQSLASEQEGQDSE